MVRPAAGPVSPAMTDTAIVWFRRDLRIHDHPALTVMLASSRIGNVTGANVVIDGGLVKTI